MVRYRQARNSEAAQYLEKGLASGRSNPEAEEILRNLIHERPNRGQNHLGQVIRPLNRANSTRLAKLSD
jgi:hypothetical protein